jgi:ubiquinone/menaquinone biosynthesis C-methylase UbiE
MTKVDFNIYHEPADFYDATLSPEYIDLCYMPARRLIEQLLKPEETSVLDLCCGTGIMAEQIRDLQGLTYLGLDINQEFLRRARERMAGLDHFQFLEADLLTFNLHRKFDIALLINGYHHFKNPVKSQILRKVHKWLKTAGFFFIAEMCIERYETREEFGWVNKDFYHKRIEWIKKNETISPKKLAAWQNVCDLSAAAEDEYKVDYGYIMRDFQTNGFVLDHKIRIWPPEGEQIFEDPEVGEFLFLFRKNT